MTLPVGLIALDDTVRIVAVNGRAAEWLGYDASALEGQPFARIASGATGLFFATHVLPALAEGRRVEEVYVSLTTHGGDALAVVLNAERSDDDGVGRVECAFLPMRRRRMFERELVAAERALKDSARTEHALREEVRLVEARMRHHERLAWLGTLAAGIGHELNNPLAYVSANVELIAERARQGEVPRGELDPSLEEIRDGLARVRSVVSNLKALSRGDVGPAEPVDLTHAVKGAIRVVEARVRERASLHLALEESLRVMGDELRLGQVVQNLVTNAAEAFGEGDPRVNRITVRTSRSVDDTALLEVFDNGPGMPPEVQQHIFDPFFTTKPAGVGTGLGLSICHGIVTAAGGTISVESAPGQGTSFHVQLRLAPAPVAAPAVETVSASSASAPSTRHRALIIDDDATVARTVRRALGAWNAEVDTSSTAALARLRADDSFDLVICDLKMPVMSGPELFAVVSRELPSMAARFVFLTGGASDEETRRFLEVCGRPQLPKPFSIAELRSLAEEVATQPRT